MVSSRFIRSLGLLALLGLAAAGGAMLSPRSASGQAETNPEPGCARWEISTWNPGDTCNFQGANPYINRGAWCTVPGGAEPVAISAVGAGGPAMWGIRRCKSNSASVPQRQPRPATAPLTPAQLEEKQAALDVVSGSASGRGEAAAVCETLMNSLAEQAMELGPGPSVAALQAIEDVGTCTSQTEFEALTDVAVRFGLSVSGH